MLHALSNLRRAFLVGASALAVGSVLLLGRPAPAKEFTFDEKTNAELAKKLKIPVYFAVPASARAALPSTIELTAPDRMVDFKHPDARKAEGDIGLRVAVMRRAGLAQRLFKSGLIQTGDILLTVRPEWGGAGPYPNIQMGVSHTGMAYLKDGAVRNIDNPLDQEYLGPGYRADLNSAHYNTLNMLHVIRPRYLTDDERKNLEGWATRFNTQARRIYPSQISFNGDYNAPKYQSGKPLSFVQHVAQSGLGQNPKGNVGMFCSEFVWSLLSLRKCDPAKTDPFKSDSVASCIEPIMQPMRVTGDFVGRRWRSSYSGLADGPLIVVETMKLPSDERDKLLHSIFVENPAGLQRMSVGHRKVATDMKPKFEPLEKYYKGSFGMMGPGFEARMISYGFNKAVPDNYSPTSYLINTLLQPNNKHRTMDYVATILIE
jgi:hypothetical protein